MSKAGDFFQNPVTGDAAIVRIGTDETDGELLVADLYIAPSGGVMGEHYHPAIEERFTLFAVNWEFGCPDAESKRRPALCCSSLLAFRTTGGTPGRKMRFALNSPGCAI